jgi:hypothetical protein
MKLTGGEFREGGRGLPPTVASFQILNDARNERQHLPSSGAALHSVGAAKRSSAPTLHVAAISSPASDAVSAGQSMASRSMSVCVLICGSENSHVPSASQA